MFDFRYHAVSLAAVLVALVVGLLLGVAIGDANLVSSAQKDIGSSLRRDVRSAERENTRLSEQLAFRRRFEDFLYPDLVGGQLAGKMIGLIFLGGASDRVNALVRSALVPTGAHLALVAVVREPPDLAGLAEGAVGTRYSGLPQAAALVRPFGVRIGAQLAQSPSQDRHRLLEREGGALFSSYNGSIQPLDGVVVMRNPGALRGAELSASEQLETGMLHGLTARNVPVVGVETSASTPSEVPWYRDRNLASVDDLDDLAGRSALVFALAGARGAYGIKPTAESLLPRVLGTNRGP